MAYGDRWDRALESARDVVTELGPEDRLTLVLFSDDAEAANQPTGDQATLLAVMNSVQPTATRTRYGPALQLARDLLDQSERPRRELVLITDFQRIGWDERTDLRMPGGTAVSRVDASQAETANLAVTNASLDRSPENGGRLVVSARIVNGGSSDIQDVPVDFEINDQVLQTQRVDVMAATPALVRFAAVALPDRPTRGAIRITGDRLPTDNSLHFIIRPIPQIRVLLVEHPQAPASETVYLRRALEIGRDPAFQVTPHRTSRIIESDLADQAVVILNDVPFPGGQSGRLLNRFVESGGGMLVAFGRRGGGLPVAMRDSVGGPTGEPVDRGGDRGATLSITDYNHPIFAPFATPRSGDFSSTRFFRYRRLEVPLETPVLARLDDGSPALVDRSFGTGRVLLWASDLSNAWNDLAIQPVFLPFLHQATKYLADFQEAPAWYLAGQAFDLTQLEQPTGTEVVVEAPSGERSALTLTDGSQISLREPGFYLVRGLAQTGDEAYPLAVNPDVVEADLTPLDPEELLAAITPQETASATTTTQLADLGLVEQERRQRLWWYLLFGVLLVFAVEPVVAGRVAQAVR
jgi:hypothetical protein